MARVTKTGVATIGANESLFKKATVQFSPPAFGTPPVVVATAHQDPKCPIPINDTFAVTVTKVTTTAFDVNIQRVDGGTCWGQNLELFYYAAEA